MRDWASQPEAGFVASYGILCERIDSLYTLDSVRNIGVQTTGPRSLPEHGTRRDAEYFRPGLHRLFQFRSQRCQFTERKPPSDVSDGGWHFSCHMSSMPINDRLDHTVMGLLGAFSRGRDEAH